MRKVVYIILTAAGVDRLIYQILPDLLSGKHPVSTAGFCFFDEHANILNLDEPIGVQLMNFAAEKGIILMTAEGKSLEGDLAVTDSGIKRMRVTPAECPVVVVSQGQQIACFPDLYAALAPDKPDFMISL